MTSTAGDLSLHWNSTHRCPSRSGRFFRYMTMTLHGTPALLTTRSIPTHGPYPLHAITLDTHLLFAVCMVGPPMT